MILGKAILPAYGSYLGYMIAASELRERQYVRQDLTTIASNTVYTNRRYLLFCFYAECAHHAKEYFCVIHYAVEIFRTRPFCHQDDIVSRVNFVRFTSSSR